MIAVVNPAGPPPTTITSHISSFITSPKDKYEKDLLSFGLGRMNEIKSTAFE